MQATVNEMTVWAACNVETRRKSSRHSLETSYLTEYLIGAVL